MYRSYPLSRLVRTTYDEFSKLILAETFSRQVFLSNGLHSALIEEASGEDTLLYVFQSPWPRLLLKKVFALQSSFLKINQVNAGVSSSSLS